MNVRQLTHGCAAVLCLVATLIFPLYAAAETQTIDVGGVKRSYELIGASTGKPRPLILALHGNMGTGAQFLKYAGWDKLAAAQQIVVAAPDGTNRAWNDGRSPAEFMGRKPASGIDDVAFLTELVEHLITRGIADRRSVFVTGISNGGMMTYRLLCDRTALFAAGAAVIANMPDSSARKCRPSRPVPMLIMNGTADRLIPYEGKPGSFLSTAQTAAFWRALNGCAADPQRQWLPPRSSGNGTKVERISYKCPPANQVVVYRVENGGHQMPSHSTAFVLEAMLGPRNRDIEGAEEIWAFFSQFVIK